MLANIRSCSEWKPRDTFLCQRYFLVTIMWRQSVWRKLLLGLPLVFPLLFHCIHPTVVKCSSQTYITLWKIDLKYLEGFEMCCWRRMGKISWIDWVKKLKILHRVKEEKNDVLYTRKQNKCNWLVTSYVGTAFQRRYSFKGRRDVKTRKMT